MLYFYFNNPNIHYLDFSTVSTKCNLPLLGVWVYGQRISTKIIVQGKVEKNTENNTEKVQAKYDKAVEKSNKSNRAKTDCLMWIASGFIKAQTELQRKSSGSGDRQQQEALIDGRGVREPSPLLEIL